MHRLMCLTFPPQPLWFTKTGIKIPQRVKQYILEELLNKNNLILSPAHRRLLTPTSVALYWDCFNFKQMTDYLPDFEVCPICNKDQHGNNAFFCSTPTQESCFGGYLIDLPPLHFSLIATVTLPKEIMFVFWLRSFVSKWNPQPIHNHKSTFGDPSCAVIKLQSSLNQHILL